MTELAHQEEFQEMLRRVMNACRHHDTAISIAVCNKDRTECTVNINGNGEDVAYMVAEQMFDFCKSVADESGIPIKQLAQLTYSEFTNYFNLLLARDNKQMNLLDNPQGRA